MMWEVFPLYEWEVQGYYQILFYVWYKAIKTQSLTEFRNSIFRRLLFLTLVLKNKDTNTPNIICFYNIYTAQKMKFFIKDFFSKSDQIRSFLWIWSHLLKKSLMENFIFCAVLVCFRFQYFAIL